MTIPVDAFERTLRTEGLHAALRLLNGRTSHRFTGVYRYEGEWLRNVALVDRWDPQATHGDDAPMDQTFCALVPGAQGNLEVVNGAVDVRFPWMQSNAVVSYCGTLIRAEGGEPFGTLCHFDLQRCEAASSEFPMLMAAAPLLYQAIAADRPLP